MAGLAVDGAGKIQGKKLRKMDLADLREKRALASKAEYIRRIKSVIQTNKAQTVAKASANKLRFTCKQVVKRQGAAADN